jgi:heptaprenyl diphosphate synthase
MTRSVIELTVTAEDRRVAWLATAAVGLSLVDAAIPSPLPGVKPGLANIVTLVVLARYGWGTAVWVSALRVLAGSLLLGYFLAPGFFLSLTGTTLSLLTLGLARHLPQRWFGPVSLSILAAFAHIGGQLLLARVWLIPHDGVFLLTPVFATAALVFGTINGLIAAKLLAEPAPTEAPKGS